MPTGVGSLLRAWRGARGVSQESLAARAGVSTRHLSFIETGRSRPGRDVLLALAGALDVPLRDQNQLLLAAGLAPGFTSAALDGDELAMVRRALDHALGHHEPYPAVVCDRLWNLVRINRAATRMLAELASGPPAPEVGPNLVLALLHPAAWKPAIVNWDEVAGDVCERLHRDCAAAPTDRGLAELRARALAVPGVPARWRSPRLAAVAPFATVHLRRGPIELRLFTMVTTLGTPLDVTAAELRIESYFPADDASDRVLRSWAPT
ncbi:MAG: helix-turn-helix transcriptional regulator [Kofleriaceae bacterium]